MLMLRREFNQYRLSLCNLGDPSSHSIEITNYRGTYIFSLQHSLKMFYVKQNLKNHELRLEWKNWNFFLSVKSMCRMITSFIIQLKRIIAVYLLLTCKHYFYIHSFSLSHRIHFHMTTAHGYCAVSWLSLHEWRMIFIDRQDRQLFWKLENPFIYIQLTDGSSKIFCRSLQEV